MNIRHLKIFKAVCEEGSLTRAAERLHVTQPAVSNTINELEQLVGTPLFDRISRKIQINEAGKLFLSKTIKLLDLYDELESSARQLGENALIRLGSSISIARFILPQTMARFERLCPGTPTSVVVENSRAVERMVAENRVDLGLVEGVVAHRDLVCQTLSSYRLVAVCSPEHPAAEGLPDVPALIRQRLLLREQGSAIRDVLDSALLLRGLKAEPAWTSTSSEALIAAAVCGLGVSILPEAKVRRELQCGELVELELEGLELTNSNHLIFHRDKYRSAGINRLAEIIGEVISDGSATCDKGGY